ncbi:D-glycero-beta-D-manno-heptose-7-phosphate kinase [Mucilaginibacter celer]|uniref:D-glycero-beta-D-manno-heptose-7-phosphate kinase n=1 Tax=Mucilaginibacter celer TaxID=2305508 RepID=A0A494VV06_9SPHI|nr:D-glycero-beta-D-manno-heptose-7-phosphate kinase [Mucilaginibacter celer]AYL95263.1 D-glycero-beta-D-manno-heptose-7-phosphate kinase [Mucilaginibacter celer]
MLTDKVQYLCKTGVKPNILLIGDLMIDHYIYGTASRLSPEAPVPVVNISNESTTLGGAGNVLKNLVALGANVHVAGITGCDDMGAKLMDLLLEEGGGNHSIIKDNSRATTVKSRVLVGNHQMLRLDKEVTNSLSGAIEKSLYNKVMRFIDFADVIIFSDYNKGVFSSVLTQRFIKAARQAGKKVLVDPKGADFTKYKGASVIKPNRKELAEAAKVDHINTIDQLRIAADVIFKQTDADNLVVTLSEQGMVVLSRDSHIALPVEATEVFDVTGAGDTVLATMAYFLALNLPLADACTLANHAAAIVIKHLGSATTTIEEILSHLAAGERKIAIA